MTFADHAENAEKMGFWHEICIKGKHTYIRMDKKIIFFVQYIQLVYFFNYGL